MVVNIYTDKFDVYCGRPGKGWAGTFGNPFKLQRGDARGATIEKFRAHFLERVERDAEFRQCVLELRGKRLGCFCKPLPCHADVIACWVNAHFGDE